MRVVSYLIEFLFGLVLVLGIIAIVLGWWFAVPLLFAFIFDLDYWFVTALWLLLLLIGTKVKHSLATAPEMEE